MRPIHSRPRPLADPHGWRYSWDLVMHLVGREFRLRYRRALLGWTWAVASPLLRLAVLTYIFTQVLPLGIENYGLFVFSGLISWQWFSAGVASATTSAVERRELLFRPGLPRAAIPVVSVLTDGLDYLAAVPVLAFFLLVGDGIPLTAAALPVVLLAQFLLTLGLGFALCSANVFLRDVHLFVRLATLIGWYATPVFYQASDVPGKYRWLLDLNPMAHLLKVYRAMLVEGRLPDIAYLGGLLAACLLTCVIGYAIYRRASPLFVDQL